MLTSSQTVSPKLFTLVDPQRADFGKQKRKVGLAVYSPGTRKAKKRKTGVITEKGSGFLRQEIDSMQELLEHLSISRQDRKNVLRLHADLYPKFDCSMDILKRKFSSLHHSKAPSGDPTIPTDSKRAKQAHYVVTKRAGIGQIEK